MAASTGSAVAKKVHAERMAHPTSMNGPSASMPGSSTATAPKGKPATKAKAAKAPAGGAKLKFGSPEWRAKYAKK